MSCSNSRMYRNIGTLIIVTIFLTGCAATRRVPPVGTANDVEIMGFEGLSVFADEPSLAMQKDIIRSVGQESPEDFPRAKDGFKEYSMLAVSGGAANGAYGAGILKGWTASGKRPKFKVVTGISTGAITAPFAFLGGKYDSVSEEIYTTMSTDKIMKKYSAIHLIYGNSFASNKPLERIIKSMVTDEILAKIAAEHARGRRLYIGTTNLDSQRLVLWDMGKIATIGGKKGKKLFCEIIRASSAIPGIFPPVLLDVELDGKKYREMHVDGGIMTQVFFLNGVLSGLGDSLKKEGVDVEKLKYELYVIRNGYVSPIWKEVPNTLAGISERAFDTLINSQGVGDMYRLYVFSEARGIGYNATFVPQTFRCESKEMFDTTYMKKLFDFGYERALQGEAWSSAPPGFQPE